MSIVTIIFTLLANRAVIERVFQLLAPIIGEITSGNQQYAGVQPVELLAGYNTAWTQAALKRLGAVNMIVNGEYGEETAAAVKAFQLAHPPLKSDGVAGVQTIAVMETELAKLKPL